MLNRPDYKKLVKMVMAAISEQKKSGLGLVAITRGSFQMNFRSRHDFGQSWPTAMKELNLVDDGTGTNTFTLKGHGFTDVYMDSDAILSEVSKHRK